MNVEEAADGTVIVSYDGRWLTKVMLTFAVLFFVVGGYDVFFGARGTDRARDRFRLRPFKQCSSSVRLGTTARRADGLCSKRAMEQSFRYEAIRVLREEERLSLVEAKQRVDALIRPPRP